MHAASQPASAALRQPRAFASSDPGKTMPRKEEPEPTSEESVPQDPGTDNDWQMEPLKEKGPAKAPSQQ